MLEGVPDPITIVGAAILLVVLWLVMRFVLQLAAVFFRIGCFVLFVFAVGAAFWYFFIWE